jgi:hypothetical protein
MESERPAVEPVGQQVFHLESTVSETLGKKCRWTLSVGTHSKTTNGQFTIISVGPGDQCGDQSGYGHFESAAASRDAGCCCHERVSIIGSYRVRDSNSRN